MAEGFGDFEGSDRRIDLRCVDRSERLVVLVETCPTGSTTAEESVIRSEVRIVLVAAGFGTEIATTVLWLSTVSNLDIRCVRLAPHRVDSRLLLDIVQLVPPPEAEEFTTKLRRREQAVRAPTSGRDWTKYVITSPGGVSEPLHKRWAVLEMVRVPHQAGVPGGTSPRPCPPLGSSASRAPSGR